MELLNTCPSCQSTNLQKVLIAKDWLISSESFNIEICTICGLSFTNPRPTEAEIGKYYQSDQYLSHAAASKGFVAFAYSLVRKYALGQKLRLLNNRVKGDKTLLDIGCATGNFLAYCQENGWTATGTEPDEDAAQIAREKGLTVHKNILDEELSSTYSVITMWHVLEHVHLIKENLSKIFNLLANDGCLIIAVPNNLSFDASHYGANWAAYDVPRHLYHFTPNSLTSLLAKQGFALQSTKPMYFDSYYVSMMSEKIAGGGMLMGVYQGFLSNLEAAKTGNYSSLIYIFTKAK